MTSTSPKHQPTLISTGIAGLDDILGGGLAPNRMYLVEGDPGSGKTTLALKVLLAGVQRGEDCMYITLSESRRELEASAESHGWTLDGIHVLELIASEASLSPDARYTMFHPSDVELSETVKTILAETERIRPALLVLDSLSELRLLAEGTLRYRRQILVLKQCFARLGTSVLLIDDRTGEEKDMHLHSLAHGVITLERDAAEYGTMRRRLHIRKMRGRAFREGYHDFAIQTGGLAVFPRLVAAEHRASAVRGHLESGLEGLDSLLGGGLARGTSTLLIGAAGTGKSTIATQYARTAALRGEHATLFIFDESRATFLERSSGLGMPLESLIGAGRLRLQQVDPAELSPGEFAHYVRQAVERDGASLIVIDSLSGYLNAMPSDRFLTLHMHELLTYLGQRGVTTLLLMAQYGIIGGDTRSPVDASYLADTVMMLRYFESYGEVRQAISVIKKRTGPHERTIRELGFDGGLVVGEPLRNFQGVLSGITQVVADAVTASNR